MMYRTCSVSTNKTIVNHRAQQPPPTLSTNTMQYYAGIYKNWTFTPDTKTGLKRTLLTPLTSTYEYSVELRGEARGNAEAAPIWDTVQVPLDLSNRSGDSTYNRT